VRGWTTCFHMSGGRPTRASVPCRTSLDRLTAAGLASSDRCAVAGIRSTRRIRWIRWQPISWLPIQPEPQVRKLLAAEHFSVDGSLISA
jgi:hypothetical protein